MKLFLILLLALMAGCSSLAPPASLDEGLAYAQSQVSGFEESAAAAVQTKQISVDVAKQVLAYGDQVTTAIIAARAAETAGDTTTAQGKLALATSLLNQLAAYLAANGVKK